MYDDIKCIITLTIKMINFNFKLKRLTSFSHEYSSTKR